MIRTLSYSEISAALTCSARWDFAYGGRLAGSALRRRAIATPLSDGRAWGAAVAAWHAHVDHDDLMSIYDPFQAAQEAHSALEDSYARDIEEQRQAGVYTPPEVEVERSVRLHELLTHYIRTAPKLPNLTRLEERFEVGIPSRASQRRSSKYRFEGFIDGYTVDENGYHWVVEFKLRTVLTSRKFLDLNRQHLWYAWAHAQIAGAPVGGVIIDERFNMVPKEARRVIKARKKDEVILRPSADLHEMTTEDSYLALCAELGEPEGHELKLQALRARRWHERTEIPFRPGQLEEAGQELVAAGRLISDLDSGERYPIRNGQRYICQGCRFSEVCPAPMDQLFVESLFERVPPKRERPKEAIA